MTYCQSDKPFTIFQFGFFSQPVVFLIGLQAPATTDIFMMALAIDETSKAQWKWRYTTLRGETSKHSCLYNSLMAQKYSIKD